MAKVRFFKSNSIGFIRTEDYDLMQSDETRLYYDTDYTNITNDCYYTKFSQDINIWLQFRTDYKNFTFTLIDSNDNETDITSSVGDSIATLTESRSQYELNLTTSGLNGAYYIVAKFEDGGKPIANFQSEWFDVKESYENSLLIEWKQDNYPTNNDGILWSDKTQYVWLNARQSDYIAGTIKSVYETANYKMISTQAQPTKSKILQVEPIPDIVCERLNIALQKGYFYVNKVRFNSEETFEAERLGDTREYPIKITLRLIEDALGYAYEDYTEDLELSGDIPVPPIVRTLLAVSNTQAVGISNTKGLGIT